MHKLFSLGGTCIMHSKNRHIRLVSLFFSMNMKQNSLLVSYKIDIYLLYDPVIPFINTYQRKIKA